jgi:glycosyltransferase involved in cell wall biosynthesis
MFRRLKDFLKNGNLPFSSYLLSYSCFHLQEERRFLNFKKYKDYFKNADMVHFHFVLDLYLMRRVVDKDSIKILTVHSPETLTSELPKNNFWLKLNKKLQIMEQKAFQMADTYIYPSYSSLENHLDSFSYLKTLMSIKKVFYCPTGISKLPVTTSKEEVRKTLNIPTKAFVISYIGRHIPVKGFDILADSLLNILNSGKELYLISAGKGELINSYRNNSLLQGYWKHIEWTETPGDLINASDCFILPDRKCFFDLTLLEAMSVGIPIIASNVGGNVYVASKSKGIILTDSNVKDLTEAILKMSMLSEREKELLGKSNIKAFEEFFSLKVFAKNYVDTLADIYRVHQRVLRKRE